MYRAIMVIAAVIIGGVIFLSMFPGLKSGMSGIDTTGWIPLFATMVRFLPYALIGFFILWLLSKSRGSSG
jgi:hypothetical protein